MMFQKSILRKRCLALLHIFSGCGVVHAQDVRQPFGGEEIKHDEYLWFAVIKSVLGDELLCSASLIGKRHVLTASRCIESRASVMVEVGYLCKDDDNCGRARETFVVSDLRRHSDFVSGGGDLALLVLDRKVSLDIVPAVPNLGPAIHPGQETVHKGLVMTMVGAGLERFGGDRSFQVEKLPVRYLANKKKCRKKLRDQDMICLFAQGGNTWAGDSGSVLVAPGKSYWEGRDVVMAVQVFGPSQSLPVMDRLGGHFLLSNAADFLYSAVCEELGEYQEEWCSVPVPTPAQTRTLQTDYCTRGSYETNSILLQAPSSSPTSFPAVNFVLLTHHYLTCKGCASLLRDDVDFYFFVNGIEAKSALAIQKRVDAFDKILRRLNLVVDQESFSKNREKCANAESRLDRFYRVVDKCKDSSTEVCPVPDDVLDDWANRGVRIHLCCREY